MKCRGRQILIPELVRPRILPRKGAVRWSSPRSWALALMEEALMELLSKGDALRGRSIKRSWVSGSGGFSLLEGSISRHAPAPHLRLLTRLSPNPDLASVPDLAAVKHLLEHSSLTGVAARAGCVLLRVAAACSPPVFARATLLDARVRITALPANLVTSLATFPVPSWAAVWSLC